MFGALGFGKLAGGVLCAALVLGCGGSVQQSAQPTLSDLRKGEGAEDSQRAAQWLFAELLQPGGDPKHAQQARAALDKTGKAGLYEDLARAFDDTLHGRLQSAPELYLKAATAARTSEDPAAPLLAQFAVEQAKRLRGNTQGLWKRWQGWVNESLAKPQHLGWRTRDALLGWWGEENWEAAAKDVDKQLAQASGCLNQVRIAGPFGGNSISDLLHSHAAEDPGPWPTEWDKDPLFGQTPSVLEVEQEGCIARVEEGAGEGVFYAEVDFAVPKQTRAILAPSKAIKVWLDGSLVFDRDLREWGSWSRVGAGIDLAPGPHRIRARLAGSETSIRLMGEDGTPLVVTKDKSSLPRLVPTKVAFEANPLRPYISAAGVKAPDSPLLRYVTAFLAAIDGEAEAATLLMEPLIKDPAKATGPSLGIAAEFVEHDPIYDETQVEDLIRELHEQALAHDPGLWASQLDHVSHLAKTQGVVDAVRQLRELTQKYQQVPALLGALAKVYGELGWTPEYRRTVKDRAERFPDDIEGLQAAAETFEDEGDHEQAEQLLKRIQKLDPDTEALVDRALGRRDYVVAKAELERLRARRPDRKDLEQRLLDLKAEAGERTDPLPLLEAAIERSPKNGATYLDLADALYATGDKDALHNALVRASEAGAETAPIHDALDLLSGATQMDAYRLDARQVIREYEARAEHLEGTAARVLDYMAVWVRSDGSALMLEHEIIRVQSEEAKSRFAEQQLRGGIALHMRVLKPDGRVFEPEAVEGKPTVTLPHLEIGDYIETEQLFGSGPSPGGVAYEGPEWFFREKEVAYARSEFVLISPANRKLDFEMTGTVPTPVLTSDGPFEVRRWRVDKSPAAPDEPFSVPPSEYLPSLHASWGLGLDRHLRLLSSRVEETTPIDPRIVRIAHGIIKGGVGDAKPAKGKPTAASSAELDHARVLYRWVLDNVQDGEEDDGRRVIIGKRGNRWRAFTTLCRAAGIPVRWAVARNRLAPDPTGPMSEAVQYGATLLRVGDKSVAWVVLVDKYTPFGYLPPEVRGVSAYLLGGNAPEKVTVPQGGESDRLEFLGSVALERDGHADLQIEQVFAGKFGSGMRQGLGQLGERRVKDAIEGQILGANLRGARLVEHQLIALDEIDVPLRLKMQAEMAHFALPQDGGLQLQPPYVPRLGQFVALPSRQTAILLGQERDWRVQLAVRLPAGARVDLPKPQVLKFGEHQVEVSDRLEGATLVIDRHVMLAAGRITPEAYPEFVRFARAADAAMTREISIRF